MAVGSLEVQIFVSLAVILVSALIALIVDYLKGSNETLRAHNIELRARQEERDRILGADWPVRLRREVKPDAERGAAREPEAIPVRPVETPADAPSEVRPLEVAARAETKETTPPAEAVEPVKPAEALPLFKTEAAACATSVVKPEATPLAAAGDRVAMKGSGLGVEGAEEPVEAAPEEPAWEETSHPGPALAWLGRKEEEAGIPPAEPLPQPKPAPATPNLVLVSPPGPKKLSLPAGLHAQQTLESLLEQPGEMDGVVMLVAVNDYDRIERERDPAAREAAWNSVTGLMKEIAGPSGFAAQRGKDEFVIVFTGETGGQAQRRARQAAERLWDHQIRSLGSDAVTFSWGTVEVVGETLRDAIGAAAEQMHETRRNRAFHLSSRPMKPRAVNL